MPAGPPACCRMRLQPKKYISKQRSVEEIASCLGRERPHMASSTITASCAPSHSRSPHSWSTCRLSQLVFGFVDLLLQPQHLCSSPQPMPCGAVELCASWVLVLSSCRSTRSSTLRASLPIRQLQLQRWIQWLHRHLAGGNLHRLRNQEPAVP